MPELKRVKQIFLLQQVINEQSGNHPRESFAKLATALTVVILREVTCTFNYIFDTNIEIIMAGVTGLMYGNALRNCPELRPAV